MAEKNIEDLPPHDRRGFFFTSLSRLLGPLADAIEEKLPVDLELMLPMARAQLRPPGALAEREFLSTCYRCGSCADACPAQAIALTGDRDEETNGTPYIDPGARACVVCDELACMKACPSGALKEVDRFGIRIGLAVVDHDICLRSGGDQCRVCIDRCPLGEVAIGLDDCGRIAVIKPAENGRGCIGCGVCQEACPTKPAKAIRVGPY